MFPALFNILATLPLLLSPEQGPYIDLYQTRYKEAMASALAEGLPALIRRLDSLASSSNVGRTRILSLEAIQALGMLHPGLVPDRAERLQKMKAASAGNSELTAAVKRVEILHSYYTAASKGSPGNTVTPLSDPVLENSSYQILAKADAAFRSGNCQEAELLAYRMVESLGESPLLANAFSILGICASYRGDESAGARSFQRALLISDLPNLLGRPQDDLALSYRFIRPKPGAAGGHFDTVFAQKIIGVPELKDPQSMIFFFEKFLLVDKERVLAVTQGGAVDDNRAIRDIGDIAVAPTNQIYLLAEKTMDPGTGNPVSPTATVSGRARALRNMRSLAFDAGGTLYILDDEAGLVQGSAGSLQFESLHPARGRLVRVDGRGYIFVLSWDRRSIQVLGRDGRPLGSISTPPGSRDLSIQYFALDRLNHAYALSSDSIEIFAVNDSAAGLEIKRSVSIPLDSRPQYKNLRVIAVTPNGEVAVTGRNDDNWVIFR